MKSRVFCFPFSVLICKKKAKKPVSGPLGFEICYFSLSTHTSLAPPLLVNNPRLK